MEIAKEVTARHKEDSNVQETGRCLLFSRMPMCSTMNASVVACVTSASLHLFDILVSTQHTPECTALEPMSDCIPLSVARE